MASPILRTDTFNRANSTAGNPGGVLIDPAGKYFISSNQLTATTDDADNTANPQFWCFTPAGDSGMTANHGVVAYFLGNPGNFGADGSVRLLVRVDPTSNYAYVFDIQFAGSTASIRKFKGATRTYISGVGPASFSAGVPNGTTASYLAWFGAFENPAGTANLKAVLYKASDVTTPLLTLTATDTDAGGTLQSSTQAGLGYLWTPHFARLDTFAYDGTTAPALTQAGVAIPAPTLAINSTTSVSFVLPSECTGGTSPYTKQLTRCSTPNGTYANVGGTTTGLTLTDASATPGTPAYYRIAATDSTAGTPLAGSSRTLGATPYLDPTVYSIGCIGDSILANRPHDSANKLGLSASDPTISAFTPFASAGKYLSIAPGGPRKVVVNNQAIGGLKSTDFAPAVANLAPSAYAMTVGGSNANVGTGYLYTALQAFLASATPPTHCLVSFGINDCNPFSGNVTAAAFGAAMRDIGSALRGNGIIPVLDYDTYIQDAADNIWTPAAMALYVSYQAQVDSLIDGVNVLDGRSGRYKFGMNNTTYFEAGAGVATTTLGVHPDWDMGHFYGMALGQRLATILGIAATAGPTIGSRFIR